jgi:ABC-type Fe3+ transport system permease subunit
VQTPGKRCGASPCRLLRPSILAASLLVFLFDFTSYGVILLLGGVKFATLEVEIYLQALQFLNLPAAALLSVVQLLCTSGFRRFTAATSPASHPRSNPTA